MTVAFQEKETLGGGWSLEVLHTGGLVGHIRKHATADVYRYFDGPHNQLTPSLENADLEALKKQVAARF